MTLFPCGRGIGVAPLQVDQPVLCQALQHILDGAVPYADDAGEVVDATKRERPIQRAQEREVSSGGGVAEHVAPEGESLAVGHPGREVWGRMDAILERWSAHGATTPVEVPDKLGA